MVNSFKNLINLYNSTLQEIQIFEQDATTSSNLQKAKVLLEEIISYMNSYSWLKHKSSKEKVRVWTESGFDYKVLCEECGVSYQTARQCICWANSKFKAKIGENTLALIKEGLMDEARAAFYLHSGMVGLENFVNTEYQGYLPQAKFNIYSLKECENELKILRLISKARFQNYLDLMDEEKMAYVLWLLMGQSKKSDVFRPYILSLLRDELSAEDLISMEDSIRRKQELL